LLCELKGLRKYEWRIARRPIFLDIVTFLAVLESIGYFFSEFIKVLLPAVLLVTKDNVDPFFGTSKF